MRTIILLMLLLLPVHSYAQGWHEDAEALAAEHGYRLIDLSHLEARVARHDDALLLDVRPEYEFQDGSIPGAANFEFHLGDRDGLTPEREKAVRDFLGPDMGRTILVYCRSLQ